MTTTTYACVALSDDVTLKRIAREEPSQLCLERFNSTSNNISECADNYCIYSDNITSPNSVKYSCEELNSTQNLFFGRDKITHQCILTANSTSPSSGQIDFCRPGYCIYKDPLDSSNKQYCRPMSIDKTQKSIGKEAITGFCIEVGEVVLDKNGTV